MLLLNQQALIEQQQQPQPRNHKPNYNLLTEPSQMPRKASGTTKANAKGAIAADGAHILNSSSPNLGPVPARGGSATRGTKRRRTSNNVNSGGTEIYGSGTIIAANPFDDDHHVPLTNFTASTAGAASNKMMVMSPSQPNIHMHLHHQQPQQHQPLHQQPMHHHALPHHQPQHHLHPHPHGQMYPTHQQHHQNNHYMQQPMSIHPHSQMGTPPGGHMPPGPSPVHMQPGQIAQPYSEQPIPPPAQMPAYCAECRQPIYANEMRIMCRAGCEAYYHRHCSGLTELACELLLRESAAEWACNRCICGGRRIPVVRMHNQTDCRQ